MKKIKWVAVATLAGLSFVLPAEAAIRYHVTDLGDLPGGDELGRAMDINDAGQVVGFSYDEFGSRAFLWTSAGGMQNLGVLPGHFFSEAWGINVDGQVVGFSGAPGDYGGFLWTSGAGMQELAGLDGAYDINNHGHVVGETSDAPIVDGLILRHAAVWTHTGGVQDLGVLPGHLRSIAWAINDEGQVVGVSHAENSYRAFIWTSGGGMQDLGDLPSGTQFSQAWHINNAGQVVGESWSAATGYRAFLWTSTSGMQNLGTLPGSTGSYAFGINEAGQVVGFSGGCAFVWTSAGGMLDLNSLLDAVSAGWTLSTAQAINNSGQIVGQGRHPATQRSHAFLLTPIPELPGDYNGDGTIDAADYVVWRKNDGTPDGYNTWRANFGATAAGAGAVAHAATGPAVPEPASVVLLLFAAVGLLAVPHRWVAAKTTDNAQITTDDGQPTTDD